MLNGRTVCYKATLAIASRTYSELHSEMQQYLHHNEMLQFAAFSSLRRQHSFLLGRYLAKHALRNLTPRSRLNDFDIRYGVFHQPVVFVKDHSNMQVSIAHSGNGGAAAAFPEDCLMAIDIEKIEQSRPWNDILNLSMNEKNIVRKMNYSDNEILTIMWTVKEGLAKALKTGFTAGMELFEIESTCEHAHYVESAFTHFPHFKAYSWSSHQCCWSLVVPKTIFIDIYSVLDQITSAKFLA